jgi:hypothetical protein
MHVHVSSFVIASLLTCVLAAPVQAQSLADLSLPAFLPPVSVASPPRASAAFAPRDIVDRYTEDLRPIYHGGLFGSVTPLW